MAAVAASTALTAPKILTASKTAAPLIIGKGDFTYEVDHHFARLPAEFTWQTTHNVAVDNEQNLYVIHEGDVKKKEHPSIFVFDPKGRLVRSFGSEFQGGGHGLEIREEDGTEYVYVTGYKSIKSFAKLTLHGETVWKLRAPMESGVYRAGEDQGDDFAFRRDRFLPTNFAFLPDGGFLLADGYGSFFIHRYDRNAKWQSCFGGEGTEEGKFNTPHGLTIDNRRPEQPLVVVADRANHRIQSFTLDGKFVGLETGFGLPANIQTQGDLLLVPELYARLSILGPDNKVLAQLGDDSERLRADQKRRIRVTPDQWIDGKFITPHDACFDAAGNIFVAEYVPNLGRVTKLRKVDA